MDRQQPKSILISAVQKFPVAVLGCLRPGYLAVSFSDGVGLADGGTSHEIAVESVPIDLRTPNSQFVVVMNWVTGEVLSIERIAGERQIDDR